MGVGTTLAKMLVRCRRDVESAKADSPAFEQKQAAESHHQRKKRWHVCERSGHDPEPDLINGRSGPGTADLTAVTPAKRYDAKTGTYLTHSTRSRGY